MTQDFLVGRGIVKRFSEQGGESPLVLNGVDLAVRKGEFVTILGPSGCGKTTLLHMFAGLAPYFPPDDGELSLDGKPLRGPSADRGMVFQEYALLPWKTVQANIELPLKFAHVDKATRAELAARYIDLVGLAGSEKKFPAQLSGGMRQRVAVARALVSDPKVLLMDEPFAAVDAQTRMVLQEELTRVWESVRHTVLFVTHSVQEALFLADRLIVMNGSPGRIVADLKLDFPRPRVWGETDKLPEFIAIEKHALNLISNKDASNDYPASLVKEVAS